ncbi:MAG TPA: PilC/PilY family type IV pilus protein [Steroidobacteraceae bacterium]|nr:PilC/PilY family type IV pilus protein [Steroidobacteraceae bacterium]
MLEKRFATAAGAALVSMLALAPANAAPLAISDIPLFLSAGVKPNLIMAIDDSGSMDAEMLLRGNDGAGWWRRGASGTCTDATDNNSFVGCVANATGTDDVAGTGRLNFNNAGNANNTWKKFIYLFPNGHTTTSINTRNRRRYADDNNDHYAVPPLPAFAWSRSPEHNKAYFDPTEEYGPWPNGGGFAFVNADIFATRFDPVYLTGGAGTIDVTRDLGGLNSVNVGSVCDNATLGAVVANTGFRVYTGMRIPAGTCIRSSNPVRDWEMVRTGDCQVGVANSCLVTTSLGADESYELVNNTSIAIRYFPATFYLSAANAPPAAFGYTATPASVGGSAPDGTELFRYEIKESNFVDSAAYGAAMQNFANWFQYYRKRHLALRGGLGTSFQTLQATRVAGFTINSASPTNAAPTSPDVTMFDIDDPTNRNDLYYRFYYTWTGNGGTPNRRAVANLIRNFTRTNTGAPVTASCQRNFGMLFTDGFANVPADGDGINGVAGNADGTAGAPYQDAISNTMADAVMAAYDTPLRSGTGFPAGKVIVPSACSAATPDPRIDCNDDLHMNFYAITLGARGLQFNPDVPVDPFVTAPTWPTTFPARHPSAVDDLWHAAINGRGQLLNAGSGTELAEKLSAVLLSIAERVGSASSAAVNSGSISSDTRLFQASFDSKDWSGKLTGRDVGSEGELGTEVLATVPAADDREIVTVDGTGAAVPFVWANIGAVRQAELQPAPASDGLGSDRLDWLRGVQTGEAPAVTNFRRRTIILGDIVNSAPAFVGAPAFRYPDSLEAAPYSAFRAANVNRAHMVYAGANDGMLHAFYSDDTSATGVVQERFAFIPSAVFKNLHNLSSPTYTHRYFVDGTPVTGDAFVGGAWRTILVAGLNKGGQGIYALDVTNPSNLTEANAASVFKWEFNDSNDRDLGYTYSRPSIVRMNNGVWAAGFGNGYNNTVADDYVSTTGNAVLYVRDLNTGAPIARIDTGVGMAQDPTGTSRPNGLSTPVFVDIDGDSDVDIAYAGDLFGNLWKFNLSSANPASWNIAYSGAPLFVAVNDTGDHQPITARPNVSRGPRGVGLIVLFGTGKYLEPADTVVASLDVQSFYGLLDPNTGDPTDVIADRTALTRQTIMFEQYGVDYTPNRADVRVTTDLPIGANRGWFLDFISPVYGFQGETAVTDSLIRNDRVTFTTLVPNADPCEFGGESWLMELKLFSGGRPPATPWDLNSNNLFDDTVTIGGVVYPVSGIRTSVGITPKPAALSGERCDFLIFPGTSGGTETRCRDPGPRGSGRQSWRQAH